MAKRIVRNRKLTSDEVARLRQARDEFSARPAQTQLLASGEYVGPMSLEEYLAWRNSAGNAPLTRQLQAAITATGQSLYSIAQASGVAGPVLQRFMNGDRGITLETAAKLASYLGLALHPEAKAATAPDRAK